MEQSTPLRPRCELCEKDFSKKSNLKRHMKRYHKVTAARALSADSESDIADDVPCSNDPQTSASGLQSRRCSSAPPGALKSQQYDDQIFAPMPPNLGLLNAPWQASGQMPGVSPWNPGQDQTPFPLLQDLDQATSSVRSDTRQTVNEHNYCPKPTPAPSLLEFGWPSSCQIDGSVYTGGSMSPNSSWMLDQMSQEWSQPVGPYLHPPTYDAPQAPWQSSATQPQGLSVHNVTSAPRHETDRSFLQGSTDQTTKEQDTLRKKRKLSRTTASREEPPKVRHPVPIYNFKQSRKIRGQEERAVDWLRAKAKLRFESFYEALLAPWGVKPGHTGTCVLIPEAYKSLKPEDITADLRREKYPRRGQPCAFFSMYGHGTSVVRALAWFGQWPRNGIQLDNFIQCGPFEPMDAAQTCHHDHCVVHVTYDSVGNKQSREYCCSEARRMRREGQEVPEHCPFHQPPCLMQVRDSARSVISVVTFTARRSHYFRGSPHPIRRPAPSQRLGSLVSTAEAKANQVSDPGDAVTLHLSGCTDTA